jgi:FixJ family two-component response regulator
MTADPRRFVVAVVDDDARILESINEMLTAAGYKVSLFGCAEEFLADEPQSRSDCLISDISMPGVNGWQLLKSTQTRFPGLPVILITGRDDRQELDISARTALRYFIRKPFDPRELLTAIASVLPQKKASV